MWNLILKTLKKPDVTTVHTQENSRTFIVTVTPGNEREDAVSSGQIHQALDYLFFDFDLTVQEIG